MHVPFSVVDLEKFEIPKGNLEMLSCNWSSP